MTTTTRRPKLRRVPQRNRIEITARDKEIFRALHCVPYLRSTFILPLVGGSTQKVTKRLGQLYHGYQFRPDYPHMYWLDRPSEQYHVGGSHHAPAIYRNARRAEEELAPDGLPRRAIRKLFVSRTQLPHAMMICDVLASIMLGLKDDQSVRFITADEIYERMPEATRKQHNPFVVPVGNLHYYDRLTDKTYQAEKVSILPDAVFGLEYTKPDGSKKYACFFIEADREGSNAVWNIKKGWLRKYLAYRKMNLDGICKAHFGIGAFFVLNITSNRGKIRSMKQAVYRVTNGGGSTQHLFKSIATMRTKHGIPEPTAEFYTGPYERAGAPEFFINDP